MKKIFVAICILFVTLISSAQINLTNGLIAYYPFSGNANDASGNGHNGVLKNGTSFTTDINGNANSAAFFNGIDNFIEIADNGGLLSRSKMSFSMQLKSQSAVVQCLLAKEDFNTVTNPSFQVAMNYAPYNGGYFWVQKTGNGYCGSTSFPSATVVNTGIDLTPNTWYCLAGTYENDTIKIYLNGQLKMAKYNGTGLIDSCSNSPVRIGRWVDIGPAAFNGVIDEVRFYNRPLNIQEIQALSPCAVTGCNDWLFTPSLNSYLTVGDVDVPGNLLTVEVNYNSIALSNNGSWGHLISKHTNTMDINYALSPNGAEITTNITGYVVATRTCTNILLNKTNHLAMVYDGTALKFYSNGYLMNSVPCSGNLATNNLLTTIAQIAGTPAPGEQFTGYVNEVRIWNVARTQSQLQTYMNSSLPAPTTQPGLVAYYTFNDLLNKQGNPAFNGTIQGTATVNNANPNCGFIADSCGITFPACGGNFDFSYQQDVCNPLSVQFFGAGTSLTNPYWTFGDAGTITGSTTPTHTYTTSGNYIVRFTIDNPACNDTISKTITVNISQADIITTPDTTICFGSTKQLRAQSSPGFCWSPTTYLNDPNSNTPITSTPKTITYYYTSLLTGNNLISNGDFSLGNTGFTSQYTYNSSSGFNPGVYNVGNNLPAWHPAMPPCGDHTGTSGNGNMMMVNGDVTPNVNVWSTTVNVTPNTNYNFSAWIQNVTTINPAQLQFSIDGILLGTPFTANINFCIWDRFFANWNSGNKTSATISLVNMNTIFSGNDFALDDISFAPVSIKKDSVIITVDTPHVTALGSISVCPAVPVQLNASGGATYSWSPATGLSNANIASPVATPATTTTYTVTGTTIHGCTGQASVPITLLPKPVITKTPDTIICQSISLQLFASGGTTYSWSPAATLSNPNIANPVANPTAPVTKYYVTVTNTAVNVCTNTDSVKVSIKAPPAFSVSPDQSICLQTSAQLNASGGNIYLWSPPALVNNPVIANPLAVTNTSTTYSVTITESICNISTTLSTTVTVNPNPIVTATKSNDIDCSNNSAQLQALGAGQYTWTPSTSLNNATIPNPIATPTTTTLYLVNGVNIFGCSDTDTISVKVSQLGKSGYYMPNSFTPNGDGINDCFGIKFWGVVTEFKFIIYNRYGERVFVTTDPNQCWDGKYKSKKPEPGNYVYYIKATTTCGNVEKKGNVILIR